jgi:transposase
MSKKLEIPTKEELKEAYAREGSTISSLARHYSTSNPTVRSWLVRYGIERKSHKQASLEANNRHKRKKKPSKETLSRLYEDSTIDDLEKYFNVGQQTIYEWLKEYDIKIRSLSESSKKGKEKQYDHIQFSKEFLDSHYDRSQSIDVLAKKLNVSRSHIRQQLKINQIKIEPIETSYRSKAEIDLYDFLVSQFPNDEWVNNSKTLINPYELDIVNITKKIAIEYCGLYWHAEGSSGKKQEYHRNKLQLAKEKGFKLFTIFESDDETKVKNLLLKVLGKTTKIGARKTSVSKLQSSRAMQFHEAHHLHSAVGGSHHYGLFYDDELVMAASFGKNRFSDKYEYECSRITSHSNYTVVGGVSKLINHFRKSESPKSIITFSDLRFGEGNVYLHCDFEKMNDTPPNYWYTKKYTPILYSRVKFQKHKLKDLLETYDPLKTEYENMLDNGWDRIWDCGNAKYVWSK